MTALRASSGSRWRTMSKANCTIWFEEKWHDESNQSMTLTVYRCDNCQNSFESAFGGYKRCPFCGRKLIYEEGIKP